jgi:hypothetical protein
MEATMPHLQSHLLAPCLCLSVMAFVACTAQAGEGDSVAAKGSTYYVDARKGDDANAGTSEAKAWKTLAKANAAAFGPGDKLLLAAGQTFTGPLKLDKDDRGSKGQPVVIASFGNGRATIDGGKGNGIELAGSEYVTVRELDLIGRGRKEGNDKDGIKLWRTVGVALDGLDVSGFRLAGVAAGGDTDTRITRVNAHDNGFAGISVTGWDKDRTRNIYIGHCIASANPGDPQNKDNHSGNGIVVGGLDVGLVEYCEAFNNGWDMPRKGNGPVGIWGWGCDRLVIQFCISHDNKTQKGASDGGGFDFDGGVTNSILQYNLSYNNHGAGYLLCQYPGASRWKNNICRYNVSVNDGLTNHDSGINFWAGGPEISDALICHNVVVNGKHAVGSTHDIAGLVFRNNIFISDGESISGPLKQARFENNLYWPRKAGTVFGGKKLEDWAKETGQETIAGKLAALFGDPKLVMPEKLTDLPTKPEDLAKMRFFRPEAGSPCIGAGLIVPDGGGRDLFGNRVSADSKPCLGACESTGK